MTAMVEALRRQLESDERIAYGILFGSTARGTAHGGSDIDIAVGFSRGVRLGVRDLGALVSNLEAATGGTVDLVSLDEAGPGLAYRIFRDGRVVLERDREAMVERKARAIVEYLDFRPLEEMFSRSVLSSAARGR
jgi:predicted nucleotidyltransferase